MQAIGPRHKYADLGGGKHRLHVGGGNRFYRSGTLWLPMDFSQIESSAPGGFTHFFKKAQWGLAVDINTTSFRVYPDKDDLGKYVELSDPSAKPCVIDATTDRVEITRSIPAWDCIFRATFSDNGFNKEFVFQTLSDMPDTISMGFKVVGLTRQGRRIKDGNVTVFKLPNSTWYEDSFDGDGGEIAESIDGETAVLPIPKADMGGATFPVIVDPNLTLGGPSATGVEDTKGRAAQESTNFGSASTMASYSVSTGIQRGWMRWDISTIPPGSTIDASTLSIYVTENRTGGNVYPHNVVNTSYRDWGELTSSFRYRVLSTLEWDQISGVYAQYTLDNSTTFFSGAKFVSELRNIDVQAHTTRDLAIADGNLEFCIKAQDESNPARLTEVTIVSSESGVTAERPVLSIDYTEAGGVVFPSLYKRVR